MPSLAGKRSFSALDDSSDHITLGKAADDSSKRHIIHDLSIDALREIALYAYTTSPEIATYIDSKHNPHPSAKTLEPPKSFHKQTEGCWEMLNVIYPAQKAASDTTLYELKQRVLDQLEECRSYILASAGPKKIWETRRNAIEALAKICRSILVCRDEGLQTDIVEDKKTLPEFARAMCAIAAQMTREERKKYEEEGLCEGLGRLKGDCEWVAEVEGFETLLGIFQYVVDGDGEVGRFLNVSPRARKRVRKAYVQSGSGSEGQKNSMELPHRGSRIGGR